jgi:hypothetical protein
MTSGFLRRGAVAGCLVPELPFLHCLVTVRLTLGTGAPGGPVYGPVGPSSSPPREASPAAPRPELRRQFARPTRDFT